MEKIRYRLVFNRQNKLNHQGKALVQAEAYLNTRKAYFTTKVYLRPEEWDKKTAQVVNHPNENELNAFLYEFIITLQTIEMNFWKRGVQCTLLMLREELKSNRPVTGMTFETFALNVIESSDRKPSTKENMKTTLGALREFRRGVDFADITYSFVRDFEAHLKRQGKAANTVNKHLRQLRTLTNEAINAGYMRQEDYPFRKIKLKKERGRHTTLMPREVRKLEGLKLDNRQQRHVLDGYLFCVYTGLRFSDFRSLTEKHLVSIRGQPWLVMKMQKTETEVSVPLSLMFEGKALALIQRYGGIELLAAVNTNSDVNRTLRHIMQLADINKRVTWHSARHTCATLLIHDGVPITTVQKLLGHTSVRTTEVYAEVFPDTVVKDLKQAARKLKNRGLVDCPLST